MALNNILCNPTTGLPPISEDILIYFVTHFFKFLNLQHSTIKLYLNGIRFKYLQQNVPSPLDSLESKPLPRLALILKSIKRDQGSNTTTRLPITGDILHKMCAFLRRGVFSPFTDVMLECACTIAYFGFLRCREFTAAFDSSRHLCVGDITTYDNMCTLTLKESKTDPFRKGITIQLHRMPQDLCPVKILKEYLALRHGKSRPVLPSQPMFITDSNTALDRAQFIQYCRQVLAICGYDPLKYNGHSFRIGSATSAGAAGVEDHLIKTLGRWSSDCYCRYIRTQSLSIAKGQRQLLIHDPTS
ncbi:uncharacterized protein LOC110457051 [Mizuhopecten yessoensis]|uniref:uncharacterized protein LOC110457051 n=1 Tax=Mizuhopecten yessoensis TaxID=6573 RepID=UPI000B4592E2|nr:uncharacterized protein LOC110457051 [Mizuhopecten yessoensis]